MRKMATVRRENGISRRALMSTLPPPSFLGGNLVLKNRTHRIQKKLQMKPVILIPHWKPTTSLRFHIMIGKIMPPKPPAVAAIPVARARRRWNQCAMQVMLGVKTIDEEIPPRTLNPSMN